MQTIQLSNELEHQLTTLAKNKGITLADYVQDILTTYLSNKSANEFIESYARLFRW